jgi:predicted enzyme related to lactoylglutathione lyase
METHGVQHLAIAANPMLTPRVCSTSNAWPAIDPLSRPDRLTLAAQSAPKAATARYKCPMNANRASYGCVASPGDRNDRPNAFGGRRMMVHSREGARRRRRRSTKSRPGDRWRRAPPRPHGGADTAPAYCEGATLTERDGYEHGVPCWVDTWPEDPDTAATFYAGVFGWDVDKGAPPAAERRYYICRLRGSDVAAIGSPPPSPMPPAWTTYVWVDDADAVAASAMRAGGSLLAEPFGTLDGGRTAIVADPAGAAFGVWTPGAHRGAQRINEPSAYAMSFLRTPDPEGAKAFYGAVLGWTTEAFGPMLLWRLPGYVGGVPKQPAPRDVVAVMAPAGEREPAHWRADFWIADADAAAARATHRGGSVVAGPENAGPFREAVLADPAGATFSVSQPTGDP